ncbi:type II CAAX endopeptidase family protein [Streptomyces cinnamoneus]|nr:type II CAAX endopeptidase family protein [Streptomyces cinnamoneus]
MRFFALLLVLSVPFWVLGAVVESPEAMPMGMPLSAFMFVCPFTAAVVLVRREEGPAGPRRLLRRLFWFRGAGNGLWFALAVLVMPVLMLASYVFLRLAGMPLDGARSPFLALPVLLVVFLVSAAGEEAGWLGYALDPLQDRWGALRAAAATGTVWAAWHVGPWLQVHGVAWTAGWFLFTVFARVLIVWLYNRTRGAVLSGILFHAMINVSSSLFPDVGAWQVPAVLAVLTAVVAGCAVLLARRPRRVLHSRRPLRQDEARTINGRGR